MTEQDIISAACSACGFSIPQAQIPQTEKPMNIVDLNRF
jgi:hypothetical protein